MVGWHHQLNGHEFEQALGVDDGQGTLVCCSPWSCKALDMNLSKPWKTVKVREAWHAAVHGVTKSQTQLSD